MHFARSMCADEAWQLEKRAFAGWQDETTVPTWQDGPSADLRMPNTLVAIERCHAWLRAAAGDAEIATVAEAKRIYDTAVAKLSGAIDRVLGEAEGAAAPLERDLEEAERLVRHIDRWLEHAPALEARRTRARAVRARWAQALARSRQEGLALYRKLAAEADAAWPAIERALAFEEGFDPADLRRWRLRTVKLGRVYNRAGRDFDGPYRFATRLRGIAVAGDFEPAVAGAVDDAQQRTRRAIDEHAPWDLIAVVEGEGTIHQRNERRLSLRGLFEKVTLSTWDPAPCVTLRIVAVHAGPVAVGRR